MGESIFTFNFVKKYKTEVVNPFSKFSRSFMSDYLQPHELQHAGVPCPSPTPRAYSNSY